MADIDARGSFYLGRRHDLTSGTTSREPLLYDSADLTTHAVCVGMTGSGKTGLCLALLEEAALDGVPAIAIDPKGDLGNLLLTFPELRPADFRPWIDESLATRDGLTPDELAARTAEQWKTGLAQWDEDGERIRRFQAAVDCAIYTPGSSAGLPLTVLKSFDAPPPAVLADGDAFGDRVQAAASGLLALLGVNADPVNSREHILLSKVLEDAWRSDRNLTLYDIIHDIQAPPFAMVGAVPLNNFLSQRDRDALAMQMNNLLASPSFASWLAGEPLDVQRLLYTPAGKPRLSVISIAHLDDQQRMFVVTLLLNEVISWMRSQPGTGSLRAILYMDEVFGFFPPTANPPAKRPMLTLLKQARAYGLGCVLATQNPVDLDYKGLSNAGTWLLGRLQTERDKARVIEGLEGASAAANQAFDRAAMDRSLSALGKRVFLMNNVHDAGPTVFHSRWALSYLAGPLTRGQISTLMADRKAATVNTGATGVPPAPTVERATGVSAGAETGTRATISTGGDAGGTQAPRSSSRPLLAGDVTQRYWPSDGDAAPAGAITYRPALLGLGTVLFLDAKKGVDDRRKFAALLPVEGDLPASPWDRAQILAAPPALDAEPQGAAGYANVPAALGEKKTYSALKRELGDWIYQHERFVQWRCEELGEASRPGESEQQFRARAAPLLQQRRIAAARDRRASEQARLEQQLAQAEETRAEHRWWFFSLLTNAVARFAEIVVTGLLGRRSRKQLVTQSIMNQAMKSRRLAAEAKQAVKNAQAALAKLELEEHAELERAAAPLPPAAVQLATIEVPPRKTDVDVDDVLLAWLPYRAAADGQLKPAYNFPQPEGGEA
jgi:hypothetical protein